MIYYEHLARYLTSLVATVYYEHLARCFTSLVRCYNGCSRRTKL